MKTLKENLLEQYRSVIGAWEVAYAAEGNEATQLATLKAFAFRAQEFVERVAGPNSYRTKHARDAADAIINLTAADVRSGTIRVSATAPLSTLVSVVKAVGNDLEAGFLDEPSALVHAEVFDDLLDQADYLVSEGYIVAGAVTCGSVLESHLRNLCTKHGLVIHDDHGKRKKASRLNDELAKNKVYSSLDHKSISAWQDLRNDAAHGGENFDSTQVRAMISGVRDFIIRNLA